MDKSMIKSRTPKYNIQDEANTNELLVGAGAGAKSKRGKKKSMADEFADVAVNTSSIINTPSATEHSQVKKNSTVVPKKTSSKKEEPKKEPTEEPAYTKSGYVRPAVTMTDQLSKEQIEEKLEDYKKVDDIFKVPLGVHMRYFSNINGKMVFRMGGLLHKNTGLPEYVILSTTPTGKPGWSVQVKDTIFYRKMTLNEIKTEYQTIIDELIEKNKKLKDDNKKLNEKLAKYIK